MVFKPPPRNLSPAAVPWARWAEDNIQGLLDSNTRQDQAVSNNLKAINGSLGTLADSIVRTQQSNDGGYAENLAYTMTGTFDVYSNDVFVPRPSWATKATVIALGWESITQTVSGGSQLAPRLIIAKDPTLLGTNILRQSAVLTLVNTSGTGTVQMYPSLGWTGPITGDGVYVGLTGTGSLSSGAATYSASATAIVYWS